MATMIIEERRARRRYTPLIGMVAVFKPHPILIGQVIDISMSGAGVIYHHDSASAAGYGVVSLLEAGFGEIRDIEIKLITDVRLAWRTIWNPVSGGEPYCRAGIQFKPTMEQEYAIEKMINDICVVDHCG